MPLKLVKGRHGSPFYYLRGTVRGQRIDESTGTDSRKAASDIRTRREAELLERAIHGHRAVATFAGAVASYLEQGGEARYMKPLLLHFANSKLSAIDQAAIDHAAKTLKPRASAATINRQIHTPLSAVLKHAASRKMCALLPIERPAAPRGKTRWLDQGEAERLIEHCAKHMKPLLLFMLYTGARVSEALYLDWDQVSLARAHAEFLDTKNGESRGVPLHPLVVAALANLRHREGAVFRTHKGLPYEPHPNEDGGQIKKAFKTACREAKIENCTPHTLRHTWATWFYQEHGDLLRLMQLGGWKTMKMVERYAHVNSERNAPAINSLPSIKVGQDVGSAVSSRPIIKTKQRGMK